MDTPMTTSGLDNTAAGGSGERQRSRLQRLSALLCKQWLYIGIAIVLGTINLLLGIVFYEPFYDLERLVDHAFSGPFKRQSSGSEVQKAGADGAVRAFKPGMDLHEDNDKNLVTATFEFPGVTKDNIQINLEAGKLTVSAETKQSSDHDENGYAVRERRFGKYSRTLQLPQGVKDEEIKASMENGVLTVTFPKSAPELAPKRIAIN